MKSKLTRELRLKDGTVYQVGDEFDICVRKDNPTYARLTKDGRTVVIKSLSLWRYFDDFDEVSNEDFENAVYDSVCISLTGSSVEPDGWDEDGFPSILLAAGI